MSTFYPPKCVDILFMNREEYLLALWLYQNLLNFKLKRLGIRARVIGISYSRCTLEILK